MINTDDVELTISLRHDLAHTIKRVCREGRGKTPEEFIVSDILWATAERTRA